MITVVTVCYNALSELKKTIENVRAQSFNDFEHLIVDGGSTDGTSDFLDSYKFSPISYICEKDNGIYDAMNKSIKIASGDWIIFLNAGDYFCDDDVLFNLNNKININLDVDVVVGDAILSNGTIKRQKLSFLYLLRYNLCHQSMLIKKSFLSENLYNTKFTLTADNALLIKTWGIANLKKLDLSICRYDMGGISSMEQNRSQIWSEKLLAYRESNLHFTKKIFSVLFCFFVRLFMIKGN